MPSDPRQDAIDAAVALSGIAHRLVPGIRHDFGLAAIEDLDAHPAAKAALAAWLCDSHRDAVLAALSAAPVLLAPVPEIDVERLARALHRAGTEAHLRHKCRDQHDIRAAHIAAEYARLDVKAEPE